MKMERLIGTDRLVAKRFLIAVLNAKPFACDQLKNFTLEMIATA